jgi:hypothetical protein
MRWALSGSVFVIVHGPKPPTDAEYQATLQAYGKHLGRFRGILIHSDGGAPNSAQRKQTTDFWEGRNLPKTAIMTSSSIARGVMTALNWFFPQKLKAVKEGDFLTAFEYLEVPSVERALAEQTVARLRNELANQSAVAPHV